MSKRSTWIRVAVAVFVVSALALAARAGGGGVLDTLRRLHGGGH
jgi:hypothetical protein